MRFKKINDCCPFLSQLLTSVTPELSQDTFEFVHGCYVGKGECSDGGGFNQEMLIFPSFFLRKTEKYSHKHGSQEH